jgi:hypothetical protein
MHGFKSKLALQPFNASQTTTHEAWLLLQSACFTVKKVPLSAWASAFLQCFVALNQYDCGGPTQFFPANILTALAENESAVKKEATGTEG